MSTTTLSPYKEIGIEPISFETIANKAMEAKTRATKAADFAVKLKAEVEAGKVKPDKDLQAVIPTELDTKLNVTIVNLKKAKDDINAGRKPFTDDLNKIVKAFTTQENAIQAIIDDLSAVRNTNAKALAENNAVIKRKADFKRLKDEEMINLRSEIEIEIRTFVQWKIDNLKKNILKGLETVTAQNKDERLPKLKALNTSLDPLVYGNFESAKVSKYENSVQDINAEILTSLENELLEYYRKEMDSYKMDAIYQFNQIVKMTEDEKVEALNQAKQEIAIDSASAIDVASAEITHNADAKLAESSFTSVSEELDLPENRTGYEIIVDTPEGWIALIAYWVSVCSKDFKGNWETKTVGSMKGELEKHAHKTGTKLKSENVKYEVKYKVINKS